MDAVRERVLVLADYICKTEATVRETAKRFGVSKSTVHKDMTQKLAYIDSGKYAIVRAVLEKNKAERHLRGGEATRQKYIMKKEQIRSENLDYIDFERG